jgi:hypothetical protein
MSDQVVRGSSPSLKTAQGVPELEAAPSSPESSAQTALFNLYEQVVEKHLGRRDAEIFEKIHQWGYSDFTRPAHEFAGITKSELHAWQKRNGINLSAGRIRPKPIDLARGYAWGHARLGFYVNGLHTSHGPPSADEIEHAWSIKAP